MKKNKTCSKCGKIHNEWTKGTKCKKCRSDCQKECYYKKKELYKQRVTEYYQENKEQKLEYAKNYRKNNKDKTTEYFRKNSKKIHKQRAVRETQRRKEDPSYRVQQNLKQRMRTVLKGMSKSSASKELFGCSNEQLKQHIESLWKEGMNWGNYGVKGWHIDHIMPCDSFDFTKEEDQKKCFHYTNLQPLWAIENIKKSNHIIKRDT